MRHTLVIEQGFDHETCLFTTYLSIPKYLQSAHVFLCEFDCNTYQVSVNVESLGKPSLGLGGLAGDALTGRLTQQH